MSAVSLPPGGQILVVDCNTSFGTLPVAGPDGSVAALARLLDGNGVAAAVADSLVGRTYNDAEGNAETLRTCGTSRRLLAAAVVMPSTYLHWRAGLTAALDGGCRLVKLYVEEHDWRPRSQRFADLVEALAQHPRRPPIFLVTAGGHDVAEFARASAGTGVPLILGGVNYAGLGEALAVMERFPHVLCETSRAASPGTIELIARTVGASRLLFGSGAPARPVAAALNAVMGAAISDGDRRAILAGSLCRLLHLNPGDLPAPARAPTLRAYGGPIVDVHTHLGAGTWRFPIPTAGVDGLLQTLRPAGIGRAIASSIYAITTDLRAGNDRLADALACTTELYGYVVVNPQRIEAAAAELARLAGSPRMVGVKVHAEYSRTPTAAPAMRRLFDEIARYRKPVLIHNMGADWMPGLAAIATAHPDLPIIVAHGGGRGAGPFFRALPNVYFEFCSSAPEQGVIDECLTAVGPERVLFGSDADLISPLYVLGTYADAAIPDAVARLVYHDNAVRLFGL